MPMRVFALLLCGVIVIVVAAIYAVFPQPPAPPPPELTYSAFLDHVGAGEVQSVRIDGAAVTAKLSARPEAYTVDVPESEMAALRDRLAAAQVPVDTWQARRRGTISDTPLIALTALLLICGLAYVQHQKSKRGGAGN